MGLGKGFGEIQHRGVGDIKIGHERIPFIAAAGAKRLAKEGNQRRLRLARLGFGQCNQIGSAQRGEQGAGKFDLAATQHDVAAIFGVIDIVERRAAQ